MDETEVKVAEVEGEPVDNQMRLDVVEQQEQLIKDEELQLEKKKAEEVRHGLSSRAKTLTAARLFFFRFVCFGRDRRSAFC